MDKHFQTIPFCKDISKHTSERKHFSVKCVILQFHGAHIWKHIYKLTLSLDLLLYNHKLCLFILTKTPIWSLLFSFKVVIFIIIFSRVKVAVFSSMLGSDTSISVDSDLWWWFQSVWEAHNKLYPANPTDWRVEALKHGKSALPLMLINGGAYSIMFYTLGYRSISIFHCWSWYDAKNFSFGYVFDSGSSWLTHVYWFL